MTTITAERRVLRRYVALTALRWFPNRLLAPVMVLLVLDAGHSLTVVAGCWAVHGSLVMALEIPSGALADVVGPRAVLAWTGLALTATAALLLMARTACWPPCRWVWHGSASP